MGVFVPLGCFFFNDYGLNQWKDKNQHCKKGGIEIIAKVMFSEKSRGEGF